MSLNFAWKCLTFIAVQCGFIGIDDLIYFGGQHISFKKKKNIVLFSLLINKITELVTA